MALIADSFHMLSDVAALVVAFLSVKVSSAIWIIRNLYKQMYTLYDWIDRIEDIITYGNI